MSLLLQVEVFLAPVMTNDFRLEPGHFECRAMRLWMLSRSIQAGLLQHCSRGGRAALPFTDTSCGGKSRTPTRPLGIAGVGVAARLGWESRLPMGLCWHLPAERWRGSLAAPYRASTDSVGEGALLPLVEVKSPDSPVGPSEETEGHPNSPRCKYKSRISRRSPLKPSRELMTTERGCKPWLHTQPSFSPLWSGVGEWSHLWQSGDVGSPGSPLALLVEFVRVATVFSMAFGWRLVKGVLSCEAIPLVVLCLERAGFLEDSFLCAHWNLGFHLLQLPAQHIWSK